MKQTGDSGRAGEYHNLLPASYSKAGLLMGSHRGEKSVYHCESSSRTVSDSEGNGGGHAWYTRTGLSCLKRPLPLVPPEVSYQEHSGGWLWVLLLQCWREGAGAGAGRVPSPVVLPPITRRRVAAKHTPSGCCSRTARPSAWLAHSS